LYGSKKFNSATKHCLEILKTRPNDVETHKLLGKCYAKKEISGKAIREFEFVIEKNKDDKESLELLAHLYNDTEQYYMAIAAFESLADLTTSDTEMAEIQSVLAELNELTHNYPAAFEAYKSRLTIMPKDVETNKKLAELYIKISNYPMAIETLLLMLSFVNEPKMLLWVFETLVDLYEETEDYEKAIAYAEKLLDVQGSDKFLIRDRIAHFNLLMGKTGDCIAILEDLAMMSQNGLEVTVELADAYIKNGEYQKALDRYLILLDKATQKEAKQVNGLIGDLYIKWSIPYTEAKDYTKALELLNSATQYSPVNPEIYYQFAYNHFEQGNNSNVVEFITKALNYDKDNAYTVKYLLLLSKAQHELGNFFEEKKALTDLLNKDDKNAEGLYRLGLMYATHHDMKNAEEALEKAITYDPDMIQAKYNLALIYENTNRDKAKQLYMEVLEQDPTFIEAKNALADMEDTGGF
jgi:tetratricopeptide (TPR) repeat protein